MNTRADLHIPKKPIFTSKDLMSLLSISRFKLSDLRKAGWLQSVPGCGQVKVPYPEVVRYFESTGGAS